MTPVPWVTTPPDLIEQIVEVLLGNEYQDSVRIRASQGDGGLDVLVPAARHGYFDVYQVKKFATNLESSHKRQIRESLQRACDTHNDRTNSFLINTWLLTLPLDPTREQFEWLTKMAADLNAPFKVKWKGFGFLEGLAARYPQVADYYLEGGKGRLHNSIAALRDLVQLPGSVTGAAVEPGDVIERLGNLLRALNSTDPHYRYDFEVTVNEPLLLDRPNLVSSVVFGTPNAHITFHVYARYVNATEDRPIPITFNIVRANLTPEVLEELDRTFLFGTPVTLPESAVTDVNIDMPAGLGLQRGTGMIYLGPARAPSDQPGRSVWAVLPSDNTEPLAQLTFEMEAPTRGMAGGMRVHGVDTTGVVAATIQIAPSEAGERTANLSVSAIDPAGKPVAQVLPGLRFLSHFRAPARLAFGREYGPLNVADEFPLPPSPQIIPATALEYAESLQAISQRSGKMITFPDLTQIDREDYQNIISIGKMLHGEPVPLTWSTITARTNPGTNLANLASQPLATSQDLTVTISGAQHELGKFYTYPLSVRVEYEASLEPGPDGMVPIALIPDKNNIAIMTNRWLTPTEARALTIGRYEGIGSIADDGDAVG